MHQLPITLFLFLFTLGLVSNQPVSEQNDLATLAARFRAYREALRKDTDRQQTELRHWNGPVHKLMSELGDRLELEHLPEKQVINLLGKPDEIIKGGKYHNGMLVPKPEKHLVYWWRGGHDYLYLVVRQGKIAEARWWYAGE
ncbi:MAG: hypothetical protein HY774_07835 [Acidobacteria bacterium]|nr:hypothetical protein [Acidobacteriota bacterium]